MTDTLGYACAFDTYRGLGWAPIKLRAGTKFAPPTGFTGHDGADPSYADCHTWAEEEPDGNIAIRLPADVIGIDLDDYDGKTGAATITEGQKRWGRLPYSPRSTSRPDTKSGIRLYRIPAGTRLREQISFPELGFGGVEIIQHHHRYVMCWPSIHDKTGEMYQWYGIDGQPEDPPAYSDIPDLPDTWLEALTEPDRNNTDLGDERYDINRALTEGQPSQRVSWRLGEALAALYAGGCRHDETLRHVLALLRLGKQGQPGVKPALKALCEAFANTVGPDRPGGRGEALAEFTKMVTSDTVARMLAAPDDTEWANNLGEPPPDVDDHHTSEYDDQHGDGEEIRVDPVERAIRDKLHFLRIEYEAKRRLDDEQHPQAEPPPTTSLDELLAEPDAPTRYSIADVAPVDSRIICSAQYKAGKTSLVHNLVRSMADLQPFLGRFNVDTTMRRVVLVDTEMSRDMLRGWLRDQQIENTAAVADVITLRGKVSSFNLLDDRRRAEWAARLRDVDCDYLILDPLRPVLDALGLDEHREAGRFLVAYDALLDEAGIGDTLIVHHMGHAHERARGDSRLQDWPDVIWRLVRGSEEPGSPRYFSAYGRDVDVHEGRLGFDPGTRRLTYAAGSRRDAKIDAAKMDVIRLLADPTISTSLSMHAIETDLAGEHARDTIREATKQLVREGHLTVETGARRAKLHRIAWPCSECGLPVTSRRSRHESCPATPEEALFEP